MSNLFYDNPELYDKAFHSATSTCIDFFREQQLPASASILDIGCGTGRELSQLSKLYPDCIGFDIHPTMTAYAQKKNPSLHILQADMRSSRLNRTFDAIYSVGDTINAALSNDDLADTIATYQAHSHKGTVLLLELMNPLLFFGKFRAPGIFSVPYKDTIATGKVFYKFLKYQQVIERIRTWNLGEGREEFTESAKFRILFPMELTYFLSQQGFEVLEVFEKERNALYIQSMYVTAKYTG